MVLTNFEDKVATGTTSPFGVSKTHCVSKSQAIVLHVSYCEHAEVLETIFVWKISLTIFKSFSFFHL